MKTDLFKIGGLTVHGYGFMIALGFILAMLLGEYRAKKLGLKDESGYRYSDNRRTYRICRSKTFIYNS